jgi:SAM-dependent methyltransferase
LGKAKPSLLRWVYRSLRPGLFSFVCVLVGSVQVRLRFAQARSNKLEIGIGHAHRKPGFITSDLSLRTDYPYDFRRGLPFPDHSLDFIYAEHVFEHFSYRDLVALLGDCYRTLKPEGKLSFSVPNARIYLEGYYHPESFDYKKFCQWDFGLSYKTKIDYVNYIFYMDGQHGYMFDEENAVTIPQEAGFKTVRLRGFDPGLDQEARRYESLYVEATK